MAGLLGPRLDLGWWAVVYAVAVTPIDFGTLGLTNSSGPDLIRWAFLLPVWFLPIALIAPRWSSLLDAFRRPPLAWFMAWTALGTVSVFWAVAPRQAILIGMAMAGQTLLTVWYVYSQGWRRFATAATTGLVVVVGGGVLLDLMNGTLIDGGVEGRSAGLTTSPTTQGRLGAFIIILATAIAVWNRRSGLWSNLPFIAIAFGAAGLIFAETRTSIIAAALAVGYGFARRLTPFNRWIVGLGTITLLASAVVASSAFVDLSPFGERGDPTSVSGRTRIWPLILDLVAERPVLGYGWGAEEQLLVQAALEGKISFLAGTSHSIFLSPMLSGGLLGFALLISAIGSALGMRRRADPWITAVMLAILVSGLTEAIVHRPSVSLMLLASSLAALARVPRWNRPTTESPRPPVASRPTATPRSA